MRSAAVSLALALLCVSFLSAAAATQTAPRDWDDVVVAVLDSGIRADHVAFEQGQVVAWRDFMVGRSEPYDDMGHGTAVASMVGGVDPRLTPSHAPGVKLAIGRTLSATHGAFWIDIIEGIRWAVDEVGADVISISIYSHGFRGGPLGYWGVEEDVYDAMAYARQQRVLIVLLAGNGYDNRGLPSMSYFHTPIATSDALIVGGALGDGQWPVAPFGDMEPEVTSDYTVRAACPDTDTCTSVVSGTSFSTPLVAGAAARLIGVARSLGMAPTPEDVEDWIKLNAQDGLAPPTLEGYGYVGGAAVAQAEANLRDGTPHGQNTPVLNRVYVEEVQSRQRALWRQGLPA